ncbi:MAG: hypothetical protein EON55_07210, partial [Alphaproteobacteria bacterium]
MLWTSKCDATIIHPLCSGWWRKWWLVWCLATYRSLAPADRSVDAADTPAPLPDLSGDYPTGPNLEFDPDFGELERLAQGKPEQQYGSTIVPAEEPDWKAVEAAATALAERSYDLRILSHLAVARLHRGGIAGFAATMQVVRGLLEDRWGAVHPQLDPDDDDDPTLRANALLALAHPVRVLRMLRTMPLARSARAGSV